MKAAIFERIGAPLAITTVADPQPGKNQVVLKVERAGICGSDLHWTVEPGALTEGMILGHEFAGTVIHAPEGAKALIGLRATALPMLSCWDCEDCNAHLPFSCNKGRLVGLTVPGAFAEYVAVDSRMIQLLPAGVTFEQGALVEPLAVAHHAVCKAGDLRGSNVLILGAGPIGVAATLFALMGGSAKVVVSEPALERRTKVLEIGAHAVIDPLEENVLKHFIRIAGRRPRVVIVCAGASGLLQDAVNLVDKRGLVIVAGANLHEDRLIPVTALAKNVTMAFSGGYQPDNFERIIDEIDKKRLIPERMITNEIPLEHLSVSFELLRTAVDECKLMVNFALPL